MQTMTNSATCPVCAAGTLGQKYQFNDFNVLRCEECGTAWRSNMYTKDTIHQMYCEEDYENHPFFAYEQQSFEATTRAKNFERALDYIEGAVGKGRLLDVACGSGTFLAVANKRGWRTCGVEISEQLSKVCAETTHSEVVTALFEEASLPEHSFDAITCWDIIEHVLDPQAFLEKACSLLRPGGVLLFCTPDEDSLLARTGWLLYKLSGSLYSYPAYALHPRYHTYFFARKSFAKLLQKKHLGIVKSYSQRAFFQHSPLASNLQKKAISLIEDVAGTFDASYEFVIIARAEGNNGNQHA